MIKLRSGVRSRLGAVALAAGVLAALSPPGTAFAEPNENASCMAHESEAISPPGSSDEFEDGRPGFNRAVREGFEGPPGQTKSSFAQAKEGSHEGCDEAFE